MMVMQAAKGQLYGGELGAVARVGGQCRVVWNLFVAASAKCYKADGKFVIYSEMSAQLPKQLKVDSRLAAPGRAEWRHTSKRESCLDMAESELGVVPSRCLDRRIAERQILIATPEAIGSLPPPTLALH